ncbi:uncharacterized protein H6S33_007718 [Morchella sextelata]|uniref:uncharacterized protein n=1 Tax=Morchella sextelata TaxID=1174677 RepID=UPI001D0453E9|nr:uncharacterized protein H6S33_007718 [Morchella sextelata]KAH0603396.1 hypothetical protein H6S33_007718 [Morchella sextelata]
MVGVRLRWNVGNFPIDCDTESLADGDNAVSQSVNCDAPSTRTRTHAATHNSNRKCQQQPAAEAEAGSDGDRERFTDRVQGSQEQLKLISLGPTENVSVKSGRGKAWEEEEETKEGWGERRANTEDHCRSRDGVMSRRTAVEVPAARRLAWSRCRSPHAPGPVKFIACLVSGYSAEYHPEGDPRRSVYM